MQDVLTVDVQYLIRGACERTWCVICYYLAPLLLPGAHVITCIVRFILSRPELPNTDIYHFSARGVQMVRYSKWLRNARKHRHRR